MNNKLEIFKKKLIYRAGHRGTKEMDILLSSFVDKNINLFNEKLLEELDKFLKHFRNFIFINIIFNDIILIVIENYFIFKIKKFI